MFTIFLCISLLFTKSGRCILHFGANARLDICENSSWGNIAININTFWTTSVYEHPLSSQSCKFWDNPLCSQRQRISNFRRCTKFQEACRKDSSWSYWRNRSFVVPELCVNPTHFYFQSSLFSLCKGSFFLILNSFLQCSEDEKVKESKYDWHFDKISNLWPIGTIWPLGQPKSIWRCYWFAWAHLQ